MDAPDAPHTPKYIDGGVTGGGGGGGGGGGIPGKSAFVELQQHGYGGIRSGYQHFSQGGQDSGFPSPRGALGYPFPPMHQNSYSGYHLGSYAPPCASPPKDANHNSIVDVLLADAELRRNSVGTVERY
ncbi:conserved hypothetical protein [Culex quinquefasciatus]|uniref:Uncharacterized protein n=1 Tax=Culex quinquefasciatus TaxID=7176 RepID=B0WCN5_CULQU|nr:conserved hypothetical protein [Culex quinquefasciatus]|eukprot:XP_001846469.1 conserved hypothetical protein [Culex quinquefasciatus]